MNGRLSNRLAHSLSARFGSIDNALEFYSNVSYMDEPIFNSDDSYLDTFEEDKADKSDMAITWN